MKKSPTSKIVKGIQNPKLMCSYALNKLRFLFSKKYAWQKGKGFKRKKYKSYAEYIEHQKSKLKSIYPHLIQEYDPKYRKALRERLKKQNIIKPGMKVLCLAARMGTEVKSFLDLGCFAIGIDLNPGKENKYVVYGDFHNLQFPDHNVDAIFTNSLDHALDFDKIIKEIKRVLKPRGFLILEIVAGEEEGFSAGYYEAASWKKIEDVLSLFEKSGFKVLRKADFTYPWKGQHASLQLRK